VTGASRGIGAACALRLARDGYDVALTYARDADAAEDVAGRVRALGRAASIHRLEARDGRAGETVAEAQDALGPIDAAVLNAGITRDGPVLRMRGEAWREVIDVNLTGTWWAARAALDAMAPRGRGTVVALSSIVGRLGNAGQANYAASKAGIIGVVRALAVEAAADGVRVNAVAPGYIVTRLTDALEPAHRERLLAATPLGRLGEPEDVAGPVAYLCSDRARFVTGTVLAVDGGLAL
jgi:3-oxoacyl-[acyl-carrier protein] reductase